MNQYKRLCRDPRKHAGRKASGAGTLRRARTGHIQPGQHLYGRPDIQHLRSTFMDLAFHGMGASCWPSVSPPMRHRLSTPRPIPWSAPFAPAGRPTRALSARTERPPGWPYGVKTLSRFLTPTLGHPITGHTTVIDADTLDVKTVLETGPRTNHPNFLTLDGVNYAYVTVGGENVTKVFAACQMVKPQFKLIPSNIAVLATTEYGPALTILASKSYFRNRMLWMSSTPQHAKSSRHCMLDRTHRR